VIFSILRINCYTEVHRVPIAIGNTEFQREYYENLYLCVTTLCNSVKKESIID